MLKTKKLFIFALSISAFMLSCYVGDKAETKIMANATTPVGNNNDTLSNEQQCNISIDDKQFVIPMDNISSSYKRLDSSLVITIKGIEEGIVTVDIPNLYKCPGAIPTGYASVYHKKFGMEEFDTIPTVILQGYPVMGLELHNLNDGFHRNGIAANAVEITAIQKTNENTATKWAEYLIKGTIHTAVLKNVYHADAGDNNKDYTIKGKFVISTRIDY